MLLSKQPKSSIRMTNSESRIQILTKHYIHKKNHVKCVHINFFGCHVYYKVAFGIHMKRPSLTKTSGIYVKRMA